MRRGLPDPLRRALGSTNAIESLNAVIRQICRIPAYAGTARWQDARMAHRWVGTATRELRKPSVA